MTRRRWQRRRVRQGLLEHPVSPERLENALREIAADAGTKFEDMAPQLQDQLRRQVGQSLQKAGKLDPAAVARKADFDAEETNA